MLPGRGAGDATTLQDYTRPSVAVDAAVLTLDSTGSKLHVLQVRRPTAAGWALPGTFLHEGEVLADAVRRALADKAGVHGLTPRQLHVFDALDRDDRGWVLSVAHLAVVRARHLATRFGDLTRLMPAARPGRLPFDHPRIIARAIEDMQSRYENSPDPDGLLGPEFTLRELRGAHEAVAGRVLQRDTFARTMAVHLDGTGRFTEGGRGRPAERFRRRPQGSPMRR